MSEQTKQAKMVLNTKMWSVLVGVWIMFLCPQQIFCQTESWKVDIVSEDEPGEALVISGKVLLPDGTPAKGARIWVFQTDAEGYYKKSEKGNDLGWRQARISEIFHAGAEGQFEIQTIRPAGYPNSSTPTHVHFRISIAEIAEQEHTIFFKGDNRITNRFRNSIREEQQLYLVEPKRGVVEFNLVFVRDGD